MQSRRASPRIPYDEAVCLTPADASSRIYGRGLDLGTGGMYLVCTQSCPVGTEARCDLLLPGGPRPVTGRVVRVAPAPGGFELAIAFVDLKPGVTALIEEMVAHAMPVPVVDAAQKEAPTPPVPSEPAPDEATAASGAIRKIAVDPSSGDGIPRLALDGDSGDPPRESTLPYGTGARVTPIVLTKPLPTSLPPPCGQPLPSVLVGPELESSTETPTPTMVLPPPPPTPSSARKTVRTATVANAPAAPPETPGDRGARRVPAGATRGTGVVARRPVPPAWNWQQPGEMAAAPDPVPTQSRRVSLLDAPLSVRSLMLLAPILVLVVALVVQLSR
jgi:hypothetical protein